jgi:pyruvate dehydrogenase E2 component (dihydrolipoamide acetyltransferase)
MNVRLPRLGEGADSGTVASIFVKEGDQVKKDQPLLELESEKAVASIPSPASGTVTKLYVKEGDQIKVGAMLLALTEEGGTVAVQPPVTAIEVTADDDEEGETPAPVGLPEPAALSSVLPGATSSSAAPPPASPSIRKMARELGIDLLRVKGSERGGRIVLADVRRYIQWVQQSALQQKAATASPVAGAPGTSLSVPQVDFGKWGAVERKKMTTLRATISGRLVTAWTTIPHITQFDEADITGIMTLRKKYGAQYEKRKAHLTLTAFALKVIVPVLKKYPLFNASLDEAAQEIVYKKYIHAGIAVDTEQGLIVPVLRNIDGKNLLDLAKDLHLLAERTRQRKVSVEEMQGASFTISNQGGIGSAHFTPIINKPEVAILGIGRGVLRPVVRGKKIEKRMMLPLSLSYDHRLIDGANAARFMVELVQGFENFKESEVKL